MSKLNGEVAIVRGVSKDIGAAIAIELGAYASSRDAAELVAKRIVNDGKPLEFRGKCQKLRTRNAPSQRRHSEYGRLDALVNNGRLTLLGVTPLGGN
jgi:hypothetical protein